MKDSGENLSKAQRSGITWGVNMEGIAEPGPWIDLVDAWRKWRVRLSGHAVATFP